MESKAIFAAGCFWGVEKKFQNMAGVVNTRVGYIGGQTENPSYQSVCYENTGHAEAVEVVFDPQQVSFESLLDAFWHMHDPTQLNRQGPDVGSQYRSAIFHLDAAQRDAARQSMARQQEKRREEIVTEITPAPTFWEAEEYHQSYLQKKRAAGGGRRRSAGGRGGA